MAKGVLPRARSDWVVIYEIIRVSRTGKNMASCREARRDTLVIKQAHRQSVVSGPGP
jgi:hypothetical protein